MTDLVNRFRLTSGVTATETMAKRFLNIALHDMHLGFEYKVPWAERRGAIRTQATYSTGTLTATQGSFTLAGSGTAWNTTNPFFANTRVNGKIIVGGSRTPYRVAIVGSDTSLTLDTAFTETTAAASSA